MIKPTRDSRHVTMDHKTTAWLRREALRLGIRGLGAVIDKLVEEEKERRNAK